MLAIQMKTIRGLVTIGIVIVMSGSGWTQTNPTLRNSAAKGAGSSSAQFQGPEHAANYDGWTQSPWFGGVDVRRELQLSDEQYNSLNQTYAQAWARYNERLNGLGTSPTPQEQQRRRRELNGGFYNEFSKTVDGSIADSLARQRYYQLYWQYRGYGAFNDPMVQQQLNLTEAQLQRFSQYNRDWNDQLNRWYRESLSQRETTVRRIRESNRELRERINSTLTPEQRLIWSEMTGNPYDFQPDVYFGSGKSVGPNGHSNSWSIPGSHPGAAPVDNRERQ